MSYWGLPKGTYGIKQSELQRQFISTVNMEDLFLSIDSDPALRGAAVFFIDSNNTAICLREFKPIIRKKPISVVLHMPTKDMSDEEFRDSVMNDPHVSKLITESLSAFVSCSGFALSYFGISSAIATMALTGPIGAIVIGIGILGVTAAATQCTVGVTRTVGTAMTPELIQAIDQNEWYQTIMKGIDIISLGAVAGASYQTIKYINSMLKSGIPLKNILIGLTPQQKIQLQDELIRYMHKNANAATVQFLKSQKMYLFSSKEVRHATYYEIRQSLASFLTMASSTTINHAYKNLQSKSNQVAISILH